MGKTEPVENDPDQGVAERRLIRSKYLAIKTKIYNRKDEIVSPESEKFTSIVNEMDNLHRSVEEPREQVADAERLLDIANSLGTCFKSHTSGGVTPSDFVAALLRNFGFGNQIASVSGDANTLSWPDLGAAVSVIFKRASGCCTMVGPMKSEMKECASSVRSRSRTPKPSSSVRPEELMRETVKSGDELMPNRCSNDSTAVSESCSTPVKKLSKHQGLVIAMQSLDNAAGASSTLKKRRLDEY